MSEELQENAEAQTEEVQAGESEQPQEVTQERPDWLPEKFERPEELANSYHELERAFYTRKEELRNQILDSKDYLFDNLETLKQYKQFIVEAVNLSKKGGKLSANWRPDITA